MPGYEKIESLKMAVPGANFAGKRVGSKGFENKKLLKNIC